MYDKIFRTRSMLSMTSSKSPSPIAMAAESNRSLPWLPAGSSRGNRAVPIFISALLADFQSIRHRCIVLITTAEEGGYYIDVKVLKELEDLPTPVRSTAGAASFRMNSTIERQFEVIEQNIYDSNWIPIGRDLKLEQVILERLGRCDFSSLPKPETIYDPPAAPVTPLIPLSYDCR